MSDDHLRTKVAALASEWEEQARLEALPMSMRIHLNARADDLRNLLTALPNRGAPPMRFVSKVVVAREIAEDGDLIDHVVTEDQDGDPIPLTEALGMLRLAEHTIIDSRMDGGTPL